MIYQLKNENYFTFETFGKNKLSPRAYFIPFSDKKKAATTEICEARFCSDLVTCLSGEWEFKFFKDPKGLPEKFDTDDCAFDRVKVPSTWEYTGYLDPMYLCTYIPFHFDPPKIPKEKEIGLFRLAKNNVVTFYAKDQYNSVGVYRKKFVVADKGKTYTVAFLGVAACLDLYLNGRFVGYSEGSHNTAEFLLDEFICEGENELVAVVHRFSTGTYLETQDMFRNSGIFRDVLLYATEKKHVLDYEIKTPYSEKDGYRLTVDVTTKNGEEGDRVKVFFLGKEHLSVCNGDGVARFDIDAPDIEEWSSEKPTLYTLTIGFGSEFICEKVGFRRIRIEKDVFYFNGEKIKIKGVDHHDTDAEKGSAMNVDDMERDVRLMKEYNVNAVRTSHYPPDPLFVRLCLKYGLYVVEEADIETHCAHAAHNLSYISRNGAWKEHYLDRVKRMYKRDRNLACILMWSLGNESGGLTCQKYCYDYLKTVTDTPVHYEWCGAETEVGFDVLSEMYTPLETMKKRAAERFVNPKRMKPYFLCEYAHAMGVGPGALEDYVELFLSDDVYMGGCIWEWADHAVYHKENGNYTYGGDHHDYINDKTFCIDGLFRPDRTPYVSAYSMKTAYRPVRAKYLGDGKVEFYNTNRFISTDYLTVFVAMVTEGQEGEERELPLLLKPTEKRVVTFDFSKDKEVFLNVRYVENGTGRGIAAEQITLNERFPTETCAALPKEKVQVRREKGRIAVDFGNGLSVVFDKKKGGILSYAVNGTDLIAARKKRGRGVGVYEEIYRAPLCNDRHVRKKWEALGFHRLKNGTVGCKVKKEGEKTIVEFSYRLYSFILPVAAVTDVYTLQPGGTITLESRFTPYWKAMLPRVGKTFAFKYDFCNVRYYGRGDMANYPDMLSHAPIGIYEHKGNFGEKMIVPQASGNRCDVRWAEVTDDNGVGVCFRAVKKPFGLDVEHYDERTLASWKHIVDYKDEDATYVHVDGFVCGVGSNSCGPLPEQKYRIEEKKELTFCFEMVPIVRRGKYE